MYTVSADVPGTVGGQVTLRFDSLEKAMAQACAHVKGGSGNVRIRDGAGHVLEGDALADACRLGKSVRSDLTVI